MIDIIKSEFMKIKRKKLFLLTFICELVSIFITYVIEARNTGSQMTWMDFLYDFSGFNFMIMIITFAILISKIVDVEYKSDMWKLMFTTINDKRKLFLSKLICILTLVIFAGIVEFFGVTILGIKLGLEGINYALILRQCIFPIVGFLPFIILQFTLSLIIKNQSISIACGVIGCFLGVFGLVLPFGKILIWIYPFLTAPMTTVQNGDIQVTVMNSGMILYSILSLVVAFIMFLVSLYLYNRKESF